MGGQVGRPAKKKGSAAVKARSRAREWYRKQSPAKKKEIYEGRSKEAQREADARRYKKDKTKRDEFHKKHSKTASLVKSGKMKKGHKCSRCGSTSNVQFHHYGKDAKKGVWLCAKCNNPANDKQ